MGESFKQGAQKQLGPDFGICQAPNGQLGLVTQGFEELPAAQKVANAINKGDRALTSGLLDAAANEPNIEACDTGDPFTVMTKASPKEQVQTAASEQSGVCKTGSGTIGIENTGKNSVYTSMAETLKSEHELEAAGFKRMGGTEISHGVSVRELRDAALISQNKGGVQKCSTGAIDSHQSWPTNNQTLHSSAPAAPGAGPS